MNNDFHPIIIDLEASGFGCTSYPIEVGLALENNEKFCSLIIPAPEWTHWDEDAEKIHHIERSVLEVNGKTPKEVATQLNKILKGKTVYTDAWSFDKPWMNTLFQEADIEMEFHVSALEMILNEAQLENWHKTKEQVTKDLNLTRHRASNDAWIIQETYKRTLNIPGSIKN